MSQSKLDSRKGRRVKRVPQANVLFVRIGWAQSYDGKHSIVRDHSRVRQQGGDSSELGETNAFCPDSSGRVECVAGMGCVKPESPIDVVFVARNPSKHRHEVVGVYFLPSFSYRYLTKPKGRRAVAYASTTDFRELVGDDRPSIMWPGRMGMRRWVRRSGVILYPELFEQYIALIRTT